MLKGLTALLALAVFCPIAAAADEAVCQNDAMTVGLDHHGVAIEQLTRCLQAVRLKPETRVSIYLRRAEAYKLARNYDRALQDFVLAILIDPDNRVALNGRAEILRLASAS